MSEMVERVAKAIAEVVSRRTSDDYDIDGEIANEAARAAVEAMREPTLAMEDAARKRDPLDGNAIAADHWQAMIDAALLDP